LTGGTLLVLWQWFGWMVATPGRESEPQCIQNIRLVQL
jgi:hypothetical protein